MKRFLTAATLMLSAFAAPVAAQSCGGVYTVQRGDSLSLIADRQYQNVGRWSAIHTNNISAIGENPNSISVGMKLNLGCIDGLPTGLSGGTTAAVTAAKPIARPAAKAAAIGALPLIKAVTADDFKPFTHRGLLNDGLMADVFQAALTSSASAEGFDTFWVNDWSAHLDPMMSSHIMDLAFPWAKPDCNSNPEHERCVNFHFSDPMFEYLVLMFVDKNRPIPFSKNSDIDGRTLCRPKGYTTHMLDSDGRNWVKGNKITLVQPVAVSACFEMLQQGKVDAVVLNEFTGRTAIKEMGLKDQIIAVQARPISITGLHVLIHKSNPNADALLATVNSGLQQIKDTGQYQQIVDTHMSTIWASF